MAILSISNHFCLWLVDSFKMCLSFELKNIDALTVHKSFMKVKHVL